MAKKLPKRMRFKNGIYYLIDNDGKWKPLGSNLCKALENYLRLYGSYCTPETRDTVTDLYLTTMTR